MTGFQPTRVDREATAAMQFSDRRSYVALDGRHIYEGRDARDMREWAYLQWNGLCYFCGFPVPRGEEDWIHIHSKGRNLRDDHERNRAFAHGMMSRRGCHRLQHGREPQLQWVS